MEDLRKMHNEWYCRSLLNYQFSAIKLLTAGSANGNHFNISRPIVFLSTNRIAIY